MVKDLTEGLVLDLDMETLQDYSGNSNDGTNNGTTLTVDKDNRLNQARNCSGTSQYITVADSSSLDLGTGDFTAAIWVKPSVNNTTLRPFGKDSNSGAGSYTGWFIQRSNTNKVLVATRNYDGASGPQNYLTGTVDVNIASGWTRILFTRINNVLYLYINGKPDGSLSEASATNLDNTSTLKVGAMDDVPTTSEWNGDLFKPQVWNRGFTAEEAWIDYIETAHNYIGLFDDLSLGMDMKGDVKDFSGNGNDGTASNVTPTTDNNGLPNSAYIFNGTTSYISTTYSPTVTDFTVGVLVKPKDFTPASRNNIMNSWVTGTSSIWADLEIFSGQFVFTVDAGGAGFKQAVSSTTGYTDDSDYVTIIGVRDTSNTLIRLYIDGVQTDSVSIAGYTGSLNFTGNVVFGQRSDLTNWEPYDGDMLYSFFEERAMNAGEIKALNDMLKKGKLYPYPQHRIGGGMTE